MIYRRPTPPLSQAKLDKRGFLSFVFDGRYKFGRFYAPTERGFEAELGRRLELLRRKIRDA